MKQRQYLKLEKDNQKKNQTEIGIDSPKIDIDGLIEKWSRSWKPPVVPRQKIQEFLGDVISAKTIANCDSAGVGPPSFKIGGRRVYPKDELLEWLRQRMQAE